MQFSFLSCSLIMASSLWLTSNLDPLIVGQASNRKENVSVGVPARLGKIPENPSPVPAPFFEVFWGFSPKKSPKIESSPSPKYPQTFQGFYPRPHPRFLGIFGDRTPKKLKIKPIPVPEKSPKFFQTLFPSPPHHQNSGTGMGKIKDPP